MIVSDNLLDIGAGVRIVQFKGQGRNLWFSVSDGPNVWPWRRYYSVSQVNEAYVLTLRQDPSEYVPTKDGIRESD